VECADRVDKSYGRTWCNVTPTIVNGCDLERLKQWYEAVHCRCLCALCKRLVATLESMYGLNSFQKWCLDPPFGVLMGTILGVEAKLERRGFGNRRIVY
jgi:hypothetical protein